MDRHVGNPSSATRIKWLAGCVAFILALAPATIYGLTEIRHIQDCSAQYGRMLSDHLGQAVAENSQLWQFAVPKFTEITRQHQWVPEIVDVAVYDTDSRLIYREDLVQTEAAISISTEHALRYADQTYGMVQVKNKLDMVLLWMGLIFLLGCVGGGVLGYGIYDYALKQIQRAEHARRQAIANLVQANDSLQNMTVHDAATGAYTISYVSKRLMEAYENPAGPVAALLVDIDFFRRYNELQGHETGNTALMTMADILRRQLREQDRVGRFGGEEFIVVLPDMGVQQAVRMAEQIRAAVEEHDFPGAGQQPKGRLTVSIGLSSTETAATFQELFHQLDDALYKAKSAGRNCACAFSLPVTESPVINLAAQSPEMKAEVTHKFIHRFFRGSAEVLPQLHEPAILAFLKALEIWDPGTIQHSLRVNRIAMEIAKAMDLPKADSLTLNMGTLLHDIGKLTIGDTILGKPGRLTEDEYDLMKNHPRVGYDLIKDDPVLRKASDIVLMHHERFDGAGYPTGAQENKIPLLARICAVADAMDAMMTDRPYSQGKNDEEIRQEIICNRGGQFDPEIADVLLAMDWQCFRKMPVLPLENFTVEPNRLLRGFGEAAAGFSI